MTARIALPQAELLRCPKCASKLVAVDRGAEGSLRCDTCGASFPIVGGTPRMVIGVEHDSPADRLSRRATAESFAYEWEKFGTARDEWRLNFMEYMQPLRPGDFDGMLVLDVGTGSGRHSREAVRLGAAVIAVDAGDAIDVARANLPPEALTIQADAERLPLAERSFDIVMSIGVLHHLPDTERALAGLVRYAKPGGRVHIYLYWQPPVAWHRWVLRGVTAARRVTVKLPHRMLHALCYPLAALLWLFVVLPSRGLRASATTRGLLRYLPLRTYLNYPFGVLVNDQFDRFSAPLERRFTKPEVEAMMRRAGLRDVVVTPNYGWVADGVAPR
jgi:SAM-dependent methyltransferase/uncharacterized protein YbaR (Trm112 family)